MRMARERHRFDWAIAAFAVGGSTVVAYLVATLAHPVIHDRYLPWIVARACGLAAYVALTLLVVLGMWLRHPWRARFVRPHIEGQFRAHAALGLSCLVLLGAHMVSLALDRYAGVGWLGTVVPGKATYRPNAVTLGIVALYLLLAISATARIGGRVVGRQWLTVHRIALPTWAVVWLHGVLAGTDTPRLRGFYVISGTLVLAMTAFRLFASRSVSRVAPPSAPDRGAQGRHRESAVRAPQPSGQVTR